MELKTPKNLVNGSKRKKQANPTNWQFAVRNECKTLNILILPRRVDLKPQFPPVYDQIYNNCTSNAALAADNYYYHKPNSTWIPSTVFTYYNQRKMEGALKDPDDGSCVEIALNAIRKYGACNAKIWPNDKPYTQKPTKAAYEDGLKGHEITKYYAVNNLTQVKKALASKYPVVVSVSWAFKSIDNKYLLNTPTKEEARNCDLGHAIVIVGYNDDTQTVEIRNSRGESWGNKGYAYMTYEAFKRVCWFDDAYAIIK